MITGALESIIAERREMSDPDRWKDFHVQVTPLAQKIVNRVWGTADLVFQIRAAALVQQRLEDNQRITASAADPIAPKLTAMVHAQIAVTPLEQFPSPLPHGGLGRAALPAFVPATELISRPALR